MNALSVPRLAKLLALALAALVCSACASFSSPTLPRRSLAELEREGKLSEVTYEFSAGGGVGNIETVNSMGTPVVVASSVLQTRVEPIFRRVFSESKRRAEPGEWHLDMYYRETARNPALSITLATLFICSLGALPAYAQDDLYLEVKLKHNGETVRQTVYEESVSTWMHWFMLPWAYSDDPMERKNELIDNMILNLLHDLKRDLPLDK